MPQTARGCIRSTAGAEKRISTAVMSQAAAKGRRPAAPSMRAENC